MEALIEYLQVEDEPEEHECDGPDCCSDPYDEFVDRQMEREG